MAQCNKSIKFVKYGCRIYFYEVIDSVVGIQLMDVPLTNDLQLIQVVDGSTLFVFGGTEVSIPFNSVTEFVDRDLITDVESPLVFATEADFILYLEQERTSCSDIQVTVPGLNAPTESSLTPTDISTTSAGSTTAGALEVAVVNVGANPGTFNGIVIPAGYGRTYQAKLDPANEVFYRIASMSYDPASSGGTTFIISEIV